MSYEAKSIVGADATPSESVHVSEARKNFSELVSRVAFGRERLVVVRHGKPVAALVGVEDLKRLMQAEEAADAPPPSGMATRAS